LTGTGGVAACVFHGAAKCSVAIPIWLLLTNRRIRCRSVDNPVEELVGACGDASRCATCRTILRHSVGSGVALRNWIHTRFLRHAIPVRVRALVRRTLPRLKDCTSLPSSAQRLVTLDVKAPHTGKGTRPPRAEGPDRRWRRQIDKIPRQGILGTSPTRTATWSVPKCPHPTADAGFCVRALDWRLRVCLVYAFEWWLWRTTACGTGACAVADIRVCITW